MPKKGRRRTQKVKSNTGTELIVKDTRRGPYGRSRKGDDLRLARNRYGKGGVAGLIENTALQTIAREQALRSARSGEQLLQGRGRFNVPQPRAGTNLVGGGLGQDPNDINAYFNQQREIEKLKEENKGLAEQLENEEQVIRDVIRDERGVSSSSDEERVNIGDLDTEEVARLQKKLGSKTLRVRKRVVRDGKLVKYDSDAEREKKQRDKKLAQKSLIEERGFSPEDTELIMEHPLLREQFAEIIDVSERKEPAQIEYEREHNEPDKPLFINDRLKKAGFNLSARDVFSVNLPIEKANQFELLTAEEKADVRTLADTIMMKHARPDKATRELYRGKINVLGGERPLDKEIKNILAEIKEQNRAKERANPEHKNTQQAVRSILSGPEETLSRRANQEFSLEGNLKRINPKLYKEHILEGKHYNEFTPQQKRDFQRASTEHRETRVDTGNPVYLRRQRPVVRQRNFREYSPEEGKKKKVERGKEVPDIRVEQPTTFGIGGVEEGIQRAGNIKDIERSIDLKKKQEEEIAKEVKKQVKSDLLKAEVKLLTDAQEEQISGRQTRANPTPLSQVRKRIEDRETQARYDDFRRGVEDKFHGRKQTKRTPTAFKGPVPEPEPEPEPQSFVQQQVKKIDDKEAERLYQEGKAKILERRHNKLAGEIQERRHQKGVELIKAQRQERADKKEFLGGIIDPKEEANILLDKALARIPDEEPRKRNKVVKDPQENKPIFSLTALPESSSESERGSQSEPDFSSSSDEEIIERTRKPRKNPVKPESPPPQEGTPPEPQPEEPPKPRNTERVITEGGIEMSMDDFLGYIDEHERTGAPHPDTFKLAQPKGPDFTQKKVDPYKDETPLEKKQRLAREKAESQEKKRVSIIQGIQGIRGGQKPRGKSANIHTLREIGEDRKLGKQDEELISVAEVDYSERKLKARR